MDVNNLIRMANRIAEFFEAMPEHDEALDGVAQHIQKFWEPRMRLRILAALNEPSRPRSCGLWCATRCTSMRQCWGMCRHSAAH
jgi:hypothetical protein